MTPWLWSAGVAALAACIRWLRAGGRRAVVLRRLPCPPARAGRRLRAPSPPAPLARAMASAGWRAPERAWSAWLVLLLIGPAGAWAAWGPSPAAVTAMAALAGPAGVLHAGHGRAAIRTERTLPPFLEGMARSLRSGASLRQAVAEMAPGTPGALGAAVRRMVDDLGRGATFGEACDGLSARLPLPGVRLAVAALSLAGDAGGAAAKAIDGVASTLRERQATADEVRALSAQAVTSALVIGLAPLAFGAFAAATDARTSRFLLHTPAGAAFLLAGLALDGIGWLWMQRLCRAPE